MLLLPFAVFVPGLGGGFLFDDYPNLVSDPHWRLTALTLDGLREALGNGFSGFGGRPLALLSFALDHLRAGPDPAALKLTNIALHALNTVLVFLLVRTLVELIPDREGATVTRDALFAAAVAAVWSIHPLQVSTVLYIVQRMEIGATTGILLACLAYLQGRRRQIDGQRSWTWFTGAVLATLAGLGFKESAILAPVFIAAIEVCVLRFAGPARLSRWLKLLFTAAAITGCLAFAFVVVPHFSAPGRYAFREFDLQQRLLTQGPVLVHYLSQILLPIPDRLVFYYDNFPLSRGLLTPALTLAAWTILAALAALALFCRTRYPLASLGVAWFFVGHLLTSNVVPLEIAFEHRNYLALMGVLLIVADAGARLMRRVHLDARITIVAVVVVATIVLTTLQVKTWAEPMRLATALASRNIDSPRASYALGRGLFEQSRDDMNSPSWSLAKQEFLHAARLGARSPLPEQALIIMHARDGTPLADDIWPRLQRKFAEHVLTAESEGALWQLANCRQLEQCPLDAQALFETFIVALERNPDSARLHSMYATFAYIVLQDPDLGIAMMREAIALAPTDAQFKANLARMIVCLPEHEDEWERLVSTVRLANRRGTYAEDLQEIERGYDNCAAQPTRSQAPQPPPERR
ncbi:hypothetical protein ACF3M1_03330 [Luteimonas sp. WGS1318]|uniref:hypothetical protein n=1 Tax=Luteimonas sp. WGS1318 TaxID=3366815 RepID=UPI00372D680F